jgi:hypothetical protein
MTITLDLPEDIATALELRAAASGQDVASLLREMVVENVQDEIPVRRARPPEEFMAQLQEVIDLLPQPSGVIDDSRESIYAGRGE